jgi:thiamine biosynthesis lipoprotein
MAPQRPATRRDFLSGRAAADALARGLQEAGTKGPAGQGAPPAAHYLIEVSRSAMACQFQVVFRADRYPEGTQWAAEALDLVEQLEDRLSIYRDQSTLCDINRRAGSVAVAAEPWLFGLLEEAQRIFLETDGAFDLTAGPLSRAWGFLRRAGRMPTAAELDTALARVGGQYVQLDPASHTIRLLATSVEIDVNAIGKGYALDRAADQLREAGMADFLIHGGQSSLLAVGSHGATPEAGWTVGLQHPLRPDQRLAEFQLDNRALGTSGSGTQFFHHRGKRYGHLIDPRTGRPAEGVCSATVLAPTAAEADALATAFYVLGPEGAEQYCGNHAEVGALLVTPGPKAGTVEISCFGLDRTKWRRIDPATGKVASGSVM